VAISPFLARLRALIGDELLVLPSVAVLPWDDDGRLLIVRNAETGQWQTIGGLIEPDESPRTAAVREAKEEAGVDVELTGLRDVAGGPEYRMTYPNGDRTAYVSIVFDARVTGGALRADGDETSEARWFSVGELAEADLNNFSRSLLRELGALAPR